MYICTNYELGYVTHQRRIINLGGAVVFGPCVRRRGIETYRKWNIPNCTHPIYFDKLNTIISMCLWLWNYCKRDIFITVAYVVLYDKTVDVYSMMDIHWLCTYKHYIIITTSSGRCVCLAPGEATAMMPLVSTL